MKVLTFSSLFLISSLIILSVPYDVFGATNGGGQNSSVDAIVSYPTLNEKRTLVGPGVLSFDICFLTIDVTTLVASWNGVDISGDIVNLLSNENGNECIVLSGLNIEPGNNVFKIKVSGTNDLDQKSGTDRDRLVFLRK